MKGFRKSTRIAYWVLRALAISSALLLFSIVGIVALQPASHAIGLALTLPPTTSATSSPADMTTPTDTPTPTNTPVPTPTPTNTPTPPTQPTPTPKPPTSTPIPAPTKITQPTATPGLPMNTPVVQPTTTVSALGPAAPLPTPLKGTPGVTPSPSPSGSPTTNPGVTPIPASTSGNAGSPSTNQQGSNGGMMGTIKPLIGPIAGVSMTILLGSAGLLGVMVWRRRKTAPGASPAFATSGVWAGAQVSNTAQSTEIAPAQHRTMFPSAMQGIVQYSPLLGAPNTSQLDAPVPPPASDFRPLSIDYPQIMEVHTDKTPVPVTPASLQSLSPAPNAKFQPALQLASAQGASPASMDVGPSSGPIRTPLPEQQNAPTTYKFPEPDPLMENLMQQAQMGIFALPGKGA